MTAFTAQFQSIQFEDQSFITADRTSATSAAQYPQFSILDYSTPQDFMSSVMSYFACPCSDTESLTRCTITHFQLT